MPETEQYMWLSGTIPQAHVREVSCSKQKLVPPNKRNTHYQYFNETNVSNCTINNHTELVNRVHLCVEIS
jgi:hypothetical protein